MERTPNESQKSTRAARKSRALRPALESCEARALLSATAVGTVIEPLQFSAVAGPRTGPSVQVAGTLRLTEGPRGGLAGSLVDSNGVTLPVHGSLHGQRIDLNVRVAPGQVLHAVGPVVSAATAGGQITLHGGGLILGGGNHSVGTFTLQGSDVVLPEGHLPNPRSAVRVIAAGTTLVTTGFVGQVTHGPDAGTTLTGQLSLGKVARDGSFAGSLADPVHGAIPVSGRVVGRQITLTFDLGAGGKVGGTGPFMAERVGPGQVRLTSFGSLQTGNPADSGDWALTNYQYNGTDPTHPNVVNLPTNTLNLNNVYLYSVSFNPPAQWYSVKVTNSVVDTSVRLGWSFGEVNLVLAAKQKPGDFSGTKFISTPIRRYNFGGAQFFQANLIGADLTYADLHGANLAYTFLNYAKLTNALTTGVVLDHTILIGADLSGTTITQNIADYYQCVYDDTTIFAA